MSPALLGGFTLSLVFLFAPIPLLWWLLPLWMVFYGCATHAAGFFMPRGMKLFGWIFIVAGILATLGVGLKVSGPDFPDIRWAHLAMGIIFGFLHTVYGLYLRFSETKTHDL